jgi:diacylglycerol kinase family enzyme
MKNPDSDPLFVVTNPNSTNANSVEADVLRSLVDHDISYTHIDTRFRTAEDNIADLTERISDDAIVISAAGDGTAEQLAAVALQKQGVALGILPYGNFNDTALSHMNTDQTVLDFLACDVPTVERKPISIEVNGEHLTDSFSYATFGLTAVIAAGFRDEASRERLRSAKQSRRRFMSLKQAGFDYLRYSRKIPRFAVNGEKVRKNRRDLAFSNNPTVAGLLRFEDTYFDKDYFGARTNLNMKGLNDIITFGVPSLFGYGPLDKAEALRIQFETVADQLPFQSGGEYQEIDTESIFVYKDAAKKVSYLHPKR